MQSACGWYQAGENDHCISLDIAEEAFARAREIFDSDITKDPRKKSIAGGAGTIQELERSVRDAKAKFDSRHMGQANKASKWLARVSSRVRYYGNIVDVLVQHHPEYVSLAWGAFKFLFILVENQETLVTTLAKALSQVADSLPRVVLSTILYPTQRMKEAVARLYAQIINLLIRAKDWYEEGKLRHAINALLRPAKLRYDDIIQEIDICTNDIDQLSTAGSRAEQRDIHLELQELRRRQDANLQTEDTTRKIMLEIRELCISSQSLQSASFLDTNQRLTDLQLNQIMDNLTQSRSMDPLKSLQLCHNASKNFKSRIQISGIGNPFWNHPRFSRWNSTSTSGVIMVKGDYKTRQEVKGFAVNVVNALQQANIPTVWVLKTPLGGESQYTSTSDVLKNLVCQILRLNIAIHSERLASLSCAQFRTAQSLREWFDLLASLLEKLPMLYVVVDIEAVSVELLQDTEDFSWLSSFSSVIQNLLRRGLKTRLKVLIVSYGSASIQEPNLALLSDLVITAKQAGQATSQGRLHNRRIIGRGRTQAWRGR